MIGAFLNALGILLGAFSGLIRRRPPAARAQKFSRAALGVLTILAGLRLLWLSLNDTFSAGLKQFLLAALAVVLGYWTGKALGLQKMSNRLGRHAAGLITAAQKNPPGKPMAGAAAAALLFCAAPLGLLGAVTDGLSGFFYLLALKAVMDGLAMDGFVRIFRWPAVLAVGPVFLFLDLLTLAVHGWALPTLEKHQLTDSVNAAAGLIVCATALVIFEIRRVELANYLPGLVWAPLLTYWVG